MRGPWIPAGLVLAAASCGEARGPVYWAADRGKGEVLALDEELCVLERIPAPGARLLARADDHLWVARAGDDSRRARELVRLDPASSANASAVFEGLVALAADEHGTAYVLEREADPTERDTLLWSVDAALRRRLLGTFPAGRALAVQRDALLVGCARGELVAQRLDGAVLLVGRTAGPVHALAAGPRAGEWWMLDGDDGTSLRLLGRDLVPRWSREVARGTRAIAPVPGEERIWIAEEGRAACYGAGGSLALELGLPPGVSAAALATRTEALLYGPGALLEIDVRHGRGRLLRAQGGFAALSALVPAPRDIGRAAPRPPRP